MDHLFFYQAPTHTVNVNVPFGHSPVTKITKWEIYLKKELDFAANNPKLSSPPRPGPGSSGQPVSGRPSTPDAGARFLVFRRQVSGVRDQVPGVPSGGKISQAPTEP
jgi:hypothetical protein